MPTSIAFAFHFFSPPSAKAQYAQAPRTTEHTPSLGSLYQICPDRDRTLGNRDFSGNGPDVTNEGSLVTGMGGPGVFDGVTPLLPDRTLEVEHVFFAEEFKPDTSTAQDTITERNMNVADCEIISSIDSPSSQTFFYRDTNHELDGFDDSDFGPNSMFRRLRVKGDTGNDDIDNCTTDDTKYTVDYLPAEITVDINALECQKPNGDPPDVTEADATPALSAFNQALASLALRLENVDFSTPQPSFEPLDSFIELNTPAIPTPIRIPFTIPSVEEALWEFLIHDINSTSVSAGPDRGGLTLAIEFETTGTEVVSSCESKFQRQNGDLFTVQEVSDMLLADTGDGAIFHPAGGFTQNFLAWAAPNDFVDIDAGNGVVFNSGFLICDLAGNVTIDFNHIEAEVRIFLHVQDDGSIIFRPMDPERPEQDVFVTAVVSGQTGPCHESAFAGLDICMEPEELSLFFEAKLTEIIADALEPLLRPANQPANMFGNLITDITSGPPGIPTTNLVAIIFGDTGEDEGKVLFVTN